MGNTLRTFCLGVLLALVSTLSVDRLLSALGVRLDHTIQGVLVPLLVPAQRPTASALPPIVVAIKDEDFGPPLSLSPKYPLRLETLASILAAIGEGAPRAVFLDYALVGSLPLDAQRQIHQQLQSIGGSIYVEQPSSTEARSLSDNETSSYQRVIEIPHLSAPILRDDDGIVELFPQLPPDSLLARATVSNTASDFGGAYIDFRYSSDIRGVSFSALHTLSPRDRLSLLSKRVVLVGRASSIFLKGQATSNLYRIAAAPGELFGPELQAVMIHASQSQILLRPLPHWAGLSALFFWTAALCLALIARSVGRALTLVLFANMLGAAFLASCLYFLARIPSNLDLFALASTVATLLVAAWSLYVTHKSDERLRQDLFMD